MNTVLIIIIVSIVLFIALREFWCWYFKINERVKLLTEIKNSLHKNNTNKTNTIKVRSMQKNSTQKILDSKWECAHCGASNNDMDVKCSECGTLKR